MEKPERLGNVEHSAFPRPECRLQSGFPDDGGNISGCFPPRFPEFSGQERKKDKETRLAGPLSTG
jgi:hypothetical protein